MSCISSSDPVFHVRETHGRVLRSGNKVIANSQDIGLADLSMRRSWRRPRSTRWSAPSATHR